MNIAQRFWETHGKNAYGDEGGCISDPAQGHEKDASVLLEKEPDTGDDQNFTYDIAERFLFETDAIFALQTSVKAFVEFQSPCK